MKRDRSHAPVPEHSHISLVHLDAFSTLPSVNVPVVLLVKTSSPALGYPSSNIVYVEGSCADRNGVAAIHPKAMALYNDISEFASGDEIERSLTLRKAMIDYRDNRGKMWRDAKVPELSCAENANSLGSMVIFNNTIGHPVDGQAILLPPVWHHPDEMMHDIAQWVTTALGDGTLWCPGEVMKCVRGAGGRWWVDGKEVHGAINTCLDDIQDHLPSPLSISTVHAPMEVQYTAYRTCYEGMYCYPRTTTPSTGILGTYHNNLVVDVSPKEKIKEPDKDTRTFKDS